MRYKVPLLLLLLLLALLPVSRIVSQTPQETDQRQLYLPSGYEPTIVGTISISGKVPQPKVIDMSADPVCMEINRKPQTESLIANGNKLQDAFISVKGEPINVYRFEMPAEEVVLSRKNCQYSPRVFGVRVGQSLRIMNGDTTVHNTHATPKLNPEWNQSQMPGSPPLLKTFTRSELLIPFKCNQHPWEKAYVGVLPHPFFAVSDGNGRYEIRGLPPGTYTLTSWHEGFDEQHVEITLVPGEVRNVDFVFDVDKKRTTF